MLKSHKTKAGKNSMASYEIPIQQQAGQQETGQQEAGNFPDILVDGELTAP
jgi:hypothetical protein